MKKVITVMCFIIAILMIPVISYAESYTVNGEEMTISFDEPGWIVFTRENIKNNKQLKNLGTDYETMKSTMEKTNAYLVAVKGGKTKRIEMMVRAMENEFINNMNTLTDEELSALQAGMDETYSDQIDDYESEIVDIGDYKYIKMTGKYEKDGYDVIQYLTFINGKNYLFSVQKVIDLTAQDKEQIDNIMESIAFQVDPALTENNVEAYVADRQSSMKSNSKSTPFKIAATAVVVIVLILLLRFKNRRRRR